MFQGFVSQHRGLDGHFFTYICCKNCYDVCLKRTKINDKRGRGWPIFLKKWYLNFVLLDQSHYPFKDLPNFPLFLFCIFIICIHLFRPTIRSAGFKPESKQYLEMVALWNIRKLVIFALRTKYSIAKSTADYVSSVSAL